MNNLIFILALFSLLMGFLLIYMPAWLIRFNKIAREKIFNDDLILSKRRKWGTAWLLIACILLWGGYYRGQYIRTGLTEKLISTDRLLYQSLQHLYSRQYVKAKICAERVLLQEPENADALYQLAAAQFLLNDTVSGEASWTKAEKIAPHSLRAQRLSDLMARLKNSPAPNPK